MVQTVLEQYDWITSHNISFTYENDVIVSRQPTRHRSQFSLQQPVRMDFGPGCLLLHLFQQIERFVTACKITTMTS